MLDNELDSRDVFISPTASSQKRRDAAFLALLTIFGWVITNLNHVLAWFSRPAGSYFMGHGFFFNNADFNSYLMKIVQGQLGRWRFEQWYSPEVQPRVWFNTLYLAWGNLTGALSLSPLVALHVLRLLLLPVLLYVLYRLCRRLNLGTLGTWITMALLLLPMQLSGVWNVKVADLGGVLLPEASVFASLVYVPHFIIALICFVLLVWRGEVWLADSRFTFRRAAGLGGVTVLLAIAYPFALVSLFAWIGARFVLTWLRGEPSHLWPLLRYSLILVFSGVFWLVYYVWETRQLEGFRALWNFESYLRLPLQVLLAEMGIVGGLALGLVLWRFAHTKVALTSLEISLSAWFFSALFLFYAPIGYAPRLAVGMQIPAVLLVAYYFRLVWPRFRPVLWVQLGFSALTLFWLLSLNRTLVQSHRAFYTLTEEEQAVMVILRQQPPASQVVLVESVLANYLPVLARQRPVYGSRWESIDFEKKQEQVQLFYQTEDNRERQSIVRAWGVDYVVVTDQQRAAGFDLGDVDWLLPVFNSPSISLYRVNLPT